MATLYHDILEVIEAEINQYQLLYTLLEKEYQYITDYDQKSLAINNNKKAGLLKKLSRLNDKREFLLSKVTASMEEGIPLTLKSLIHIVPDELKDRYKECHKEFLRLVGCVKERNIYNREYLELSVKRLKAITNNILKYLNSDTTYNQRGKIHNQPMKSLTNREA